MFGVSIISLEHLMKSNASKRKNELQIYRMINRQDN